MFSTPHATTAILLSAATGNPLAAFVVGVLSHTLLDAIPHGDQRFFQSKIDAEGFPTFVSKAEARKFNVIGTVELVVAVLVVTAIIFFTDRDPLLTGLAAFGGVLPDLMIPIVHLPFVPKRIRHAYDIWNFSVHDAARKKDFPWRLGFALQFAYLVVVLLLILTWS